MNTSRVITSTSKERRRNSESSLISSMRRILITRRRMRKSIILRRLLRASGMTRSGWRRRRMSRPRKSRSGRVGPITLSRRETFSRSRSLSPRGRISCSNSLLVGFRIKFQQAIQKCQRYREIKTK
jgi:hypothetical protein